MASSTLSLPPSSTLDPEAENLQTTSIPRSIGAGPVELLRSPHPTDSSPPNPGEVHERHAIQTLLAGYELIPGTYTPERETLVAPTTWPIEVEEAKPLTLTSHERTCSAPEIGRPEPPVVYVSDPIRSAPLVNAMTSNLSGPLLRQLENLPEQSSSVAVDEECRSSHDVSPRSIPSRVRKRSSSRHRHRRRESLVPALGLLGMTSS